MWCIDSQAGNPFYNLAAEEYYLKNSDDEFFMIWESIPAVVVGKHQNTLSEINYRFITENNIMVARRLTGGGTVYHGPGNINFTFIRNGRPGQLVNFSEFIGPVLQFLGSLGIEALKGPKHEILVNGKKISGNAEHVYKNRVLHHGTLLFQTDLGILGKSIHHSGGSYSDRAVQSNRAEVINLSRCIPDISVAAFRQQFFSFITAWFKGRVTDPDEHADTCIRQIVQEKFSTWEWIYGWSPDYRYTNNWKNGLADLNIDLEVHRGIITKCNLASRTLTTDHLSRILKGKRHFATDIRNALHEADLVRSMGVDPDDLVYSFF